jgi:UDP-N-acetylmuramoyl-L-alanyl-D-glutamate--2,6-diaminopimelate ligase
MTLRNILKNIKIRLYFGNLDIKITELAYDSRQVKSGALFFALPGAKTDGALFIQQAMDNGARAIVSREELQFPRTPVIQVDNPRLAMAIASANFYHHPSKKLFLTGVTGTDGKTTTCHLIFSILSLYGSIGLMGTVGNVLLGQKYKTVRTTAEAVDINQNLAKLVKGGAHGAVMEVSSHALALHRVDDLDFDVAVFTNFSQDHLDFHSDMEDYFQAKALLFRRMKSNGYAVINLDDPYGLRLKDLTSCKVQGYSLKDKSSTVFGELIDSGLNGIRMNVYYQGEILELHSPLFGKPNAYNIVSAVSAVLCANVSPDIIQEGVEKFSGVKGRFQSIDCGDFTTIIDYAHTSEAIANLLATLRPMTKGRLSVVFGCGGNRDPKKRPLMASSAEKGADVLFLTNDNPRDENPDAIIEDIVSGLTKPAKAKIILDRRTAILTALESAKKGDVVVLAGKGHEDYQEIAGVFHYFDDYEVVNEWLKGNH